MLGSHAQGEAGFPEFALRGSRDGYEAAGPLRRGAGGQVSRLRNTLECAEYCAGFGTPSEEACSPYITRSVSKPLSQLSVARRLPTAMKPPAKRDPLRTAAATGGTRTGRRGGLPPRAGFRASYGWLCTQRRMFLKAAKRRLRRRGCLYL